MAAESCLRAGRPSAAATARAGVASQARRSLSAWPWRNCPDRSVAKRTERPRIKHDRETVRCIRESDVSVSSTVPRNRIHANLIIVTGPRPCRSGRTSRRSSVARSTRSASATSSRFQPTRCMGLRRIHIDAAAVAAVFALKGRGGDQPLPLVAADVDQVTQRCRLSIPSRCGLARAFWPGPLTLLLRSTAALAPGVGSADGLVGIRVPDSDIARALAGASRHSR